MFDALDVDEKNNPSVVASRISEIMSGENIYMLDITEEPPDAMDEPIEKKVLPDDGGHSREIVSPLHAEAAETRAEAREAAARAEVTKARTEAAKTAAWGNARIEAAEAVARAKEAAIHAEGAMARTEMWDAATEMWKPISIRNASFADELSERENDAQRLSTPRRLIDERKTAIELRALRDGVPVTEARVKEITAHDVSECKTEDTANRALIANKDARIELLQKELISQRTQFELQVAGAKFEMTVVQQRLMLVLSNDALKYLPSNDRASTIGGLTSVQQQLLAVMNNAPTTTPQLHRPSRSK